MTNWDSKERLRHTDEAIQLPSNHRSLLRKRSEEDISKLGTVYLCFFVIISVVVVVVVVVVRAFALS